MNHYSFCSLVLFAGTLMLFMILIRTARALPNSGSRQNVHPELIASLEWLLAGTMIFLFITITSLFIPNIVTPPGSDSTGWSVTVEEHALLVVLVPIGLLVLAVGLARVGAQVLRAREQQNAGEFESQVEEFTAATGRDELTKLVNRRGLQQQLTEKIATVKQGLEHALCHIDLDRFRVANDAGGRMTGDALLCEVASLLERVARRQDIVARLDGDSFAILMVNCPLEEARRVAEGVRVDMEALPFKSTYGVRLSLTTSVGVAGIVSDMETADSVMKAADDACQLAKDKGGNRVHVLHDHRLDVERRRDDVRWISRISQAIEEDRLELFAQPIADGRGQSDEQLRFEVLLRMRGTDGGLVPGFELIPRVERYHLAAQVDRWVITQTIKHLEKAAASGLDIAMCAINLSGQSLSESGFLEFVVNALDHSQIDVSILHFEITETAVIADLSTAQRFIRVLRGWGCRFALDDFGTGLCSFAYLKDLPVDLLKIDGVFVRDIVENSVSATVVAAINDIGHAAGLSTVIECVENDDIQRALETHRVKVDYLQGYAIGRPIPILEMLARPTNSNRAGVLRLL